MKEPNPSLISKFLNHLHLIFIATGIVGKGTDKAAPLFEQLPSRMT